MTTSAIPAESTLSPRSEIERLAVYRVEHGEAFYGDRPAGPYRSGWGWEYRQAASVASRMCRAHNGMEHPTPWEDGIRRPVWGMLCGFTSREDLDEWFMGWLGELSLAGFVLATYEAKDVEIGSRQVAFDPRTARRLLTESLI